MTADPGAVFVFVLGVMVGAACWELLRQWGTGELGVGND